MPTPPLSREELFSFYVPLAARITGLRAIIQNPDTIPREDVEAWAEDVRSVTQDFIFLTQETLNYLRDQFPKGEPSCFVQTTPDQTSLKSLTTQPSPASKNVQEIGTTEASGLLLGQAGTFIFTPAEPTQLVSSTGEKLSTTMDTPKTIQ